MGIIQIAAIIASFENWLGWNSFFALVGAMLIGYIPILGTIMGIIGAIAGWHLSPIWAILLFCWPFIFSIIFYSLLNLSDKTKFFLKVVAANIKKLILDLFLLLVLLVFFLL